MVEKKRVVSKTKRKREAKSKPPIAWYVGYEVNEGDRDAVVRIASRIHHLRRSIAVACYQYYQLDDTTISDHEYESRVLELYYLQLRYPKISSTVLFMPGAFSDNSFVSTGFHILEFIERGDYGSESVPGIAISMLDIQHKTKTPIFQSPEVKEKILHFSKKVSSIKKVAPR